jgi:hypothetical protein
MTVVAEEVPLPGPEPPTRAVLWVYSTLAERTQRRGAVVAYRKGAQVVGLLPVEMPIPVLVVLTQWEASTI